jgi:anti-sigma regulatory factor (Ser/Thr protein kinase)
MEVSDEAQVGAVRRAVHAYAGGIGFTERELAEIDIVVQEVGTNAARYAAGGGQIHFTTTLDAEPGLEIFYTDRGPGIYDLDRVLRDGVSTGGSLGAGLGAVRRLMDEFEIFSTVRGTAQLASFSRRTTHGTALLLRKWVAAARCVAQTHAPETITSSRRYGVWSRPHPGEDRNGDAYFFQQRAGQTLLAAVDGLGHGQGAYEAAQVALEVLAEWQGESLDEIFHAAHAALRPTRGAVMGACVLDTRRETFQYAGVGNIECASSTHPNPCAPSRTTARSARGWTRCASGRTRGRKERAWCWHPTA